MVPFKFQIMIGVRVRVYRDNEYENVSYQEGHVASYAEKKTPQSLRMRVIVDTERHFPHGPRRVSPFSLEVPANGYIGPGNVPLIRVRPVDCLEAWEYLTDTRKRRFIDQENEAMVTERWRGIHLAKTLSSIHEDLL